MAKTVKRKKTKYPNIYFNESTEKYDVKYNYKEYNPLKEKNVYKAQWVYNCITLAEARAALANLQTGNNKVDNKEITMQGAYELWKRKAETLQYSKQTIKNTEHYLKAISKYLPLNTKLKNITEEVYQNLFINLRTEYSEETIHSLNGTFRKLIQIAYQKGYIANNFLHKADNIRTKKKNEYRVLTKDEFEKIDKYLSSKESNRKGYDVYSKLRFLYNVLYYTGIRLGECLALTWGDFKPYNYYSEEEQSKKENFHLVGTDETEQEHLIGLKLKINKSILRTGEVKEPKNIKNRIIPVASGLEWLYFIQHNRHKEKGGSDTDRIFTYSQGYCLERIKNTCIAVGIEPCNCHDFRHTFISNLIRENVPLSVIEKVSGDTQETIFKRYSHMFEEDERLVLKALEKLK